MRTSRLACVAAIASSLILPPVGHAQLVRSAVGANPAAIEPSVDQFRADLGTLNPNLPGSVGSGRREINWDGVADSLAAPNSLPADFFNVSSPRGVVFSTPGTGLQVSGAGVAPVEFGNIDPSYPGTFGVFSPPRLFTALASNVVDVSFFVPGSTTPALSRGLGAVFTDVDLPNATSLSLFDASNASLGTFFAPAQAGNETLSFLGVSFANPVVSRVRIVSGTGALGAGVLDRAVDLVVLDDVVFGEPIASGAVPEPATLLLVAAGAAGFGLLARRRSPRAT
jgi:hypothetical protein